jgi:agmatine/peptidylarginine deiminase
MINPSNLLDRLTKWHWSPLHPDTYTFQNNHERAGIGRIAHECYGTFNLTWLATGRKIETRDHHLDAIKFFCTMRPLIAMVEVDKQPLSSYMLLMRERQFLAWALAHRGQIPIEILNTIMSVMNDADRVR